MLRRLGRHRFAVLFTVVLVALFAAELTAPAQRNIVGPWTTALARACAALVAIFDPHTAVYGKVLQSTANGFAVSIEPGCNGVEAAIILVAAMVAWSAPWRQKLAGIAGGLLAVQALNVVRVITLYYLGQWSLRAFEFAHLYLWQGLIMLDVLVVWLLWLRWLARSGGSSAAA